MRKLLGALFERPHVVALPATLLLFCGPAVFSSNTYFFRDIQTLFYPMKFLLGKSLRAGFLPYWCSYKSCGAPFLADIQTGVFYPLSWLFTFPLPFSLNWYVLVHLGLGFLFCHLFITQIGASPRAATLAAISFSCGGYVIATVNTLNNLSTAIWLPAILWAHTKAVQRSSGRHHLLTVLFLCLAILGGEPQLFLMMAALLPLYSLTLLQGRSATLASRLRLLLADAALLGAAFVICLPQLGPAYTYYLQSARLGGIAYDAATDNSLSWGMLKHLLLPLRFPPTFGSDPSTLKSFFPGGGQVPWLMTVYPGFLVSLCALGGLVAATGRRRLFWPAAGATALVLALGGHTPLFLPFYKAFPFFRYPVKFMFLAGFCLLVMAAAGYDAFAARAERRGVSPGVLFLIAAVVLTGDLWYSHRHLNPLWAAETYDRHDRDLDVILEDTSTYRVFVDTDAVNAPQPRDSIRAIQERWQDSLKPDTGFLRGLSYVNGINGLELRHQYLITEQLARPWPERVRFLRLANVKYIVSPQDLQAVPGLRDQVARRNRVVYEVLDPLPRAWLAGAAAAVPETASEKFRRGEIDVLTDGVFDPATTALVWSRGSSGNPSFTPVRELRYDPDGRIAVRTSADRPGILVLTESWYPGWQAVVDGRAVEPVRADLLFLGVPLGPGDHEVAFYYRPRHLGGFLAASAAGILLVVAFAPRLLSRMLPRP